MKSAVWSGHPAGLVSSIAEMEGRKILFGRKLVITFENFVLKAELIFLVKNLGGWWGAL